MALSLVVLCHNAPAFRSLLYDYIYALANLYGVALYIWLLSHAVIELPKYLYFLPSLEAQQRHACFRVGLAFVEWEEATLEWCAFLAFS